jgi:Na+-transporting NADH:ubiquinone oxidoreductase subunit C
MERSPFFTILFAAAVCGVCSVFVAISAVALKDRQEANERLDRRAKVLAVAGLRAEGEKLSREEIDRRFEERIRGRVIDLVSGETIEDADPQLFDQRRASADPSQSRVAPENAADVRRLPHRALVYQVIEGGEVQRVILPIEGMGLWSTLYGFLALESDGRTIYGITFYEHAETPGLGGEVDNPRWKALWRGRRAFDETWTPRISVLKGRAGPVEQAPYEVDGLSGATITSRGVTHLVQFWLGELGFGPYLERFRSERGV